MGDAHHLAHFFGLQVGVRYAAERVEVHDARGHYLYEVGALAARLFDKGRVLAQVGERPPHDGAVMPRLVNGEHGCAVIDTVFGSERFRPQRHSVRIAAIAHERYAASTVCLEASADVRLGRPLHMKRHGLLVIHAVHRNMGVAFYGHVSPSLLSHSTHDTRLAQRGVSPMGQTFTWENELQAVRLPPVAT